MGNTWKFPKRSALPAERWGADPIAGAAPDRDPGNRQIDLKGTQ
jgi:hypothetical protein